ncbi:nuclease domain-containing protein [Rhodohalobacter sp.]|uniref:nuclease domain-containing protein n=1 Tax=Rhodohalobacter sp. TaxID=1974210 RepID=UPI002ACE152D|nr:nuclease domain-containing protein [Rhodohalobacter sp.]MDZ7756756.1 nuclease domain-containing protein [Rhodohalobacter sp.]
MTDLLEDLFDINAMKADDLIEETGDKLGLKLSRENICHLAVHSKLKAESFMYNLALIKLLAERKNIQMEEAGPDRCVQIILLAFGLKGIDEDEAEKQELITHLHFDAKYKVESLTTLFGQDNENLDQEKEEQNKGTYKRADLLKMHSYQGCYSPYCRRLYFISWAETVRKTGADFMK